MKKKRNIYIVSFNADTSKVAGGHPGSPVHGLGGRSRCVCTRVRMCVRVWVGVGVRVGVLELKPKVAALPMLRFSPRPLPLPFVRLPHHTTKPPYLIYLLCDVHDSREAAAYLVGAGMTCLLMLDTPSRFEKPREGGPAS